MTRFLNLASKALAVVGVLTLMWTAGGMQSAKAQTPGDPTYVWPCYYGMEDGKCHGWICLVGNCHDLPATDDSGSFYCCF